MKILRVLSSLFAGFILLAAVFLLYLNELDYDTIRDLVAMALGLSAMLIDIVEAEPVETDEIEPDPEPEIHPVLLQMLNNDVRRYTLRGEKSRRDRDSIHRSIRGETDSDSGPAPTCRCCK